MGCHCSAYLEAGAQDPSDWFKCLPFPFNSVVDSAVIRPFHKRQLIMFSGEEVLVWDTRSNLVVRGPTPIRDDPWFKDIPAPFNEGVSCCASRNAWTWEAACIYMFKDDQFLLWDTKTHKAVRGPVTVQDDPWFEDLPFPFSYSLDACVNAWNNPKHMWMFSGDQFCIWDMQWNVLVRGPIAIENDPFFNKGRLPIPFSGKITCAINRTRDSKTRHLYLFNGKRWLVWDCAWETIAFGPFKLQAEASDKSYSRSRWCGKNAVTHIVTKTSEKPKIKPRKSKKTEASTDAGTKVKKREVKAKKTEVKAKKSEVKVVAKNTVTPNSADL